MIISGLEVEVDLQEEKNDVEVEVVLQVILPVSLFRQAEVGLEPEAQLFLEIQNQYFLKNLNFKRLGCGRWSWKQNGK